MGAFSRLVSDLLAQLQGIALLAYLENLTSDVFIGVAREFFTQVLPYAFHFYNIREMKKYPDNSKYVFFISSLLLLSHSLLKK